MSAAEEVPFRVLLVEDNPGDARLIRFELEEAGDHQFELVVDDRLGAALERLAQEPFDVLLLDLSLPDSQGLDTFRRVCTAHPDLPIVVLTGLDDERIAVATMQGGGGSRFKGERLRRLSTARGKTSNT